MSTSRKSAGPRGSRKRHALRRHGPKVASSAHAPPSSHARSLVHHIVSLEALGWRITELRPSVSGGEAPFWHVRITRVDLDATMSVSAAAPDLALAELVRYASADATPT